jgi:hypothetical protein
MSYRGKSRVHFRGSRDGSGPFIPARRAVDDGNNSLRRTTGGGDASAGDGDALRIAADCDIHDQRFAASPAGRNATVKCSHAMAECDAAEFLFKCGCAIPGGEACSWETWVRFQSLRSKRWLRRCDGLPIWKQGQGSLLAEDFPRPLTLPAGLMR